MLAKILRTYGGQEGRRVKAGTIFAVGDPQGDYVVITLARYRQLAQQRLAEEFTGDRNAAAPAAKEPSPRNRRAPTPGNKMEPESAPRQAPAPKTPTPRRAARRKGQEDAPKSPRPLSRQSGGPAGSELPASSSPADRQAGGVTFRQRGNRRGQGSAGSPSTTPSSSSPGPTSSTPATGRGGVRITKRPEDSAAFD